MSSEQPITVGVVGLGYWGPNLARNMAAIEGCELSWLCDPREDARARVAHLFPEARCTGELEDLLADQELAAVVLATPVPTHAELAVRVVRAGKHCFVEKPLATNTEDAEAAIVAAEEAGRTLMVGHLLEYHPAVVRLRETLRAGELGSLYYIHSSRLNLGQLRADENALGAWEPTTSRSSWPSSGKTRTCAPPTAAPLCARASRTSSSATWPSPQGSSPTCTSPGSTPTRSGA